MTVTKEVKNLRHGKLLQWETHEKWICEEEQSSRVDTTLKETR